MLTFRVAQPDDWPVVASLHTQSWQQTYRGMLSDTYLTDVAPTERQATWQQRFNESATNQLVVLAEEAGTVVGFICLYIDADAQWGTLVDNLHVLPTQKGQGIGTALMRVGVRAISERATVRYVYLYVLEANTSAVAFYDRIGGQRAGSDIHTMPDGNRVSVWRYVWPISAFAETD